MPLLALAALIGVLVVGYWSTLVAMVTIWDRSGTFAHCYLVAPISIWLIWRRRDELLQLTPHPLYWVLLPMSFAAFAWLLGEMAGVNALTQFAFTSMLIMAVPLVLGWDVARRITFPLLYLLFMVPFGEFLLPSLMEWTADFTVAAVRLSGIPVYREGLQFVIPSGSWSVVEACSGVRYLIASLMVGSLFAYLNYSSTKRRVLFGLVSLTVPLVANWLRAYMIVMLGHLSGNKLAVGVDHLIYGWVFFGLIVGVMFFIGSRWAEAPADPEPSTGIAEQPAGNATMQSLVATGLCVVILLAPHGTLWLQNQSSAQAGDKGPLVLADLQGTSSTDPKVPFVPHLQNPAATALRSYATNDGVVHVHVGYYRQQGYGRKLVTSSNALVNADDQSWQITRASQVKINTAPEPTTWRQAEVLGGTVGAGSVRRQRFDTRQIYWVDGEFTASGARATLLAVRGKLLGHGDDGAMLTLYTEGEDKSQTEARLDSFIRAHTEALDRQLLTYRGR